VGYLGYYRINNYFVFKSAFCRALSKRFLPEIRNPSAIALLGQVVQKWKSAGLGTIRTTIKTPLSTIYPQRTRRALVRPRIDPSEMRRHGNDVD